MIPTPENLVLGIGWRFQHDVHGAEEVAARPADYDPGRDLNECSVAAWDLGPDELIIRVRKGAKERWAAVTDHDADLVRAAFLGCGPTGSPWQIKAMLGAAVEAVENAYRPAVDRAPMPAVNDNVDPEILEFEAFVNALLEE